MPKLRRAQLYVREGPSNELASNGFQVCPVRWRRPRKWIREKGFGVTVMASRRLPDLVFGTNSSGFAQATIFSSNMTEPNDG
jgi:hypothetical protein